MTHPYADLPDRQFWRRAMAGVEPHRIDPAGEARVRIGPGDRVATAGSCFAQHIARRLRLLGLGYFVAEDGGHLPEPERAVRHYGLFSARYGNIYTAEQLWQLWQEAFEGRRPQDRAWPGRDGGWIDPFRPTVEPGGFASPDAVAEDRARHLAAVRRLFTEADVLVFTLGLTETWRSCADGSVYPLAPGVAGGAYDPAAHSFCNFDVAATEAALAAVLQAAKVRNPGLRVILTVSPVPLAATYEPRSVLASTTWSKAVLRVAAEAMRGRFDFVDYFPSYEIITGPPTGGLYFEPDAREVNALGVAHVMRVFTAHHVEGGEAAAPVEAAVLPDAAGIVCDEAMIDAVRG